MWSVPIAQLYTLKPIGDRIMTHDQYKALASIIVLLAEAISNEDNNEGYESIMYAYECLEEYVNDLEEIE